MCKAAFSLAAVCLAERCGYLKQQRKEEYGGAVRTSVDMHIPYPVPVLFFISCSCNMRTVKFYKQGILSHD